VEREHDNIRAALRWLIDHGEAEYAQRLSGAMGSFWQLGGRASEGRMWLSEVHALPDGRRKTTARVRMRDAGATLATEQADYAIARLLAEEALELGRELADDLGTALALRRLALLAWYRREFALARTFATEGAVTSLAAGVRGLEGSIGGRQRRRLSIWATRTPVGLRSRRWRLWPMRSTRTGSRAR
jgi:non-specific serine/threonine protein kinase